MSSDPAQALDRAQSLHNAGQAGLAEPLYRRIVADWPQTPEAARALTNLGVILQERGELEAALSLHHRALVLAPALAEGFCNRGDTYSQLDRLAEAEADFGRAAELAPALAPAWFNRGNVLLRLGRATAAETCYRRSRDLLPRLAQVPAQLARALAAQGRAAEAMDAMADAVALAPGDWSLLNDLGVLQQQAGRIAAAKASLRRAIDHCPGAAVAHYNLGNACYGEGDAARAAACYRRAWELDPRLSRAASNYLNCLHYLPEPGGAAIAACHREVAAGGRQPPGHSHANSPEPKRRLRIGYVSADFVRHPLGLLLLPILAAHDRSQVFVACYSNRRDGDDITQQLRRNADLWRDILPCDDETLDRMIRDDAIDILVDLDGHTAGGRLGLFARKPAPIQVGWLGYPFTTGLTTMDYALLDRATVPAEAEAWFSERVVCLPVSRFCYQGPETPKPAPPPMRQRGFVTFGSFNNIAKLTPEVIAAWADILHRVPGSRLLLKWPHLAQAEIAERILTAFRGCGIAAGRIQLRGNSPPEQLRAEYADMDIALDPFPYCGAFTSCEALWMGVPVVTLPGPRPFSRQTLALLSALGLADGLAAQDIQAYRDLAVGLAGDPDRLSRLRRDLRPQMRRALGDVPRHAAALEAFFRRAWIDWCQGADAVHGGEGEKSAAGGEIFS